MVVLDKRTFDIFSWTFIIWYLVVGALGLAFFKGNSLPTIAHVCTSVCIYRFELICTYHSISHLLIFSTYGDGKTHILQLLAVYLGDLKRSLLVVPRKLEVLIREGARRFFITILYKRGGETRSKMSVLMRKSIMITKSR